MLTTPLQKKKRRNSFYLSQKTDSLISSVSHVIDVMETVLLPLPLDVFGKGRHCEEIVGVVCMLIKDVCLPYMDIAKEKVRCNEMKLDHLIKNHRTHPSILGSLVIRVLIQIKPLPHPLLVTSRSLSISLISIQIIDLCPDHWSLLIIGPCPDYWSLSRSLVSVLLVHWSLFFSFIFVAITPWSSSSFIAHCLSVLLFIISCLSSTVTSRLYGNQSKYGMGFRLGTSSSYVLEGRCSEWVISLTSYYLLTGKKQYIM